MMQHKDKVIAEHFQCLTRFSGFMTKYLVQLARKTKRTVCLNFIVSYNKT